MFKLILKIISAILTLFISLLIFINFIGLETKRFDSFIKTKANEVNKDIKLDFNKVKINLQFSELNIIIKLQDPKILIKGNEFNLSKFDLVLSIKSILISDFILKETEIEFSKINLKELKKIANVSLPKLINFQLNKIFEKGSLEGEFLIPFDEDGSVSEHYSFFGKIMDAKININKEIAIKNLTSDISYNLKKNKNFNININKGTVFNLQLDSSAINLINQKDNMKVKSKFNTNGNLNFNQIKKISTFLGFELNFLKDINAQLKLRTNVNFDLNSNYSLKNLDYYTEGDILRLKMILKNKKSVKKYLPEIKEEIVLKNTYINFKNIKTGHNFKISGKFKTNNLFDNFDIQENYQSINKKFNIKGNVDLTNTKIILSKLNFIKKNSIKTEIKFNTDFILDKYFNINYVKFLSSKSKINLSNIKLNKKFELKDFKSIEVKTFLNKVKNNDFIVKKLDKILISGEVYDAEPLIKNIFSNNKSKNIFNKRFTSDIKLNLGRALTGTKDDVFDFSMIAKINNGSYEKLSLKGNFSDKEFFEMSLYKISKDNKSLQIISDRAKPFVKHFDFIEGFEGGRLEYESIISQKSSTSNLKIIDFKVAKVPALAQLLTLASLQGIADTLSGEGIRFENFEMKSITKGNWIEIEETFASGPAVSILLSGYVDKSKLVSLRGTLVPARTLNSIISSIPVLGEILVGKKTGEGVFGVSFKMKGEPKNIKTTVNPIKTLTPRFIVRAVESIKKNKKKKTK